MIRLFDPEPFHALSSDSARAAVGTSERENDRIDAASTWPWRSSTVRGFLTTVHLPLVVWGVQEAVTRTLLR